MDGTLVTVRHQGFDLINILQPRNRPIDRRSTRRKAWYVPADHDPITLSLSHHRFIIGRREGWCRHPATEALPARIRGSSPRRAIVSSGNRPPESSGPLTHPGRCRTPQAGGGSGFDSLKFNNAKQ